MKSFKFYYDAKKFKRDFKNIAIAVFIVIVIILLLDQLNTLFNGADNNDEYSNLNEFQKNQVNDLIDKRLAQNDESIDYEHRKLEDMFLFGDMEQMEKAMKDLPDDFEDLINNLKPQAVSYYLGGVNDKEKSIKQIVRENSSACVVVYFKNENDDIGHGSGFVISRDGVVVTSYHVIDPLDTPKIIQVAVGFPESKKVYPLESILFYDETKDIALIKIKSSENNFSTIKLGDSNKVERGDEIVTIGSPIQYPNTVFNGIVSAVKKNRNNIDMMQISVPTTSGNSGGAVFNRQGQAISIIEGKSSYYYGINFAMPINYLKEIIDGI